jgi:rhodanese-related sulfurtransferase
MQQGSYQRERVKDLLQRCRARLFLAILLFTPLFAHAFVVPEGIVGITAPEVRKMMTDDDVLLVHSLSQIEYQMQHIPGSINIPVDEMTSSSKMPADKDAQIIFYCNGRACPYSVRASKIAVEMGYTQIHWFRGGIFEWRKYQYKMVVNRVLQEVKVAKLSPAKLQKIDSDEILILDVRPQWWRQSEEHSGMIQSTDMRIPLIKLDIRLKLLPKDRPIIIVDRMMRQSIHAAKYLKSHGFNILGVLKGGSRRWVSEHLPVLDELDEPAILGGT